MFKKKKLQRINIFPDKYTTGDAQEWTYEYTWEDFEATRKIFDPGFGSDLHKLLLSIRKYFAKNPEKLLEGGVCKQHGLTPEYIRDALLGKKATTYF